MAYTLINARPSPFGRKVAIVMLEKGIAFDVQYDVPWGEDTRTPEFSPLEQLPILITEAGEHVYDSAYIVDWLEARCPQPALLPADLDARLAAQQRRMLGERMLEIAQALSFELLRPEPSAGLVDRQSRKVCGGLAALERLYQQRTLTAEQVPDLGDIAVATTLLGIEFAMSSGLVLDTPVLHWRDHAPALEQAVMVCDARPSFMQTRPQMMDINLHATVA